MNAMPPREWVNIKEAAEWVGLSVHTIRRAKHAGKLNPKKTGTRGGKELYRVSELRQWVESMEDA